MEKLDLLPSGMLFGNDQVKKSPIFQKYGMRAPMSDYAICTGGMVSYDFYVNGGNSFKDRCGIYYIKPKKAYYTEGVFATDGDFERYERDSRPIGFRPVFFDFDYDLSAIGLSENDILEIEYGEYPQSAVDSYFSMLLETSYNYDALLKTGKEYVTGTPGVNEFIPQMQTEYEYNSKKYVRMKIEFDDHTAILSNGRHIQKGDVVWIAVEPIKYLVDLENHIAIAKNIILAGIYCDVPERQPFNYRKMSPDLFLDQYLKRELIDGNKIKICSSNGKFL